MKTLRETRTERLISQRQLATMTGVAQSTIVHIENGTRLPRLVTMRRLAEALGVMPGDITEFATAMSQASEGKAAA